MSELKPRHTPLPWAAQEGMSGRIEIIRDNGDKADRAVGKIAEVYACKLYSPEGFANAKLLVHRVNAHEGLIEALESYEKAILALTDKQLIDNQLLMSAVVNGRAALAQAKGGE